MEKQIAQFDKNASEEVRVQLREFRGHQLFDIRVYFRPDDGGDPRPTKKGISVSVNLIPKIQDAIEKALKALKAEGIEPKAVEADKGKTEASEPAGDAPEAPPSGQPASGGADA